MNRLMSKDIECPYCGADTEINHDDGYGYDENGCYQQECPACEKVFVYTTWIVVHHEAKKADCLNGGDHNYQKTNTIPEQFSRLRCSQCGDEKPL